MADETVTREELVEGLDSLLFAFREHLTDEAHRRDLDVLTLCPCWTYACRSAEKLLQRATDGERPMQQEFREIAR